MPYVPLKDYILEVNVSSVFTAEKKSRQEMSVKQVAS
jgi:hypothetical protein